MSVSIAHMRVLIVEDQPEARVVLKDMLNDLGIEEVFEADDGSKALQYISGAPDSIDVILCDWNMPSVSGIDLFKQVRETGAATPFVMITGRCDYNSVMKAKNIGINFFLRKPYTPAQVEAKLRIALQGVKTP